MPNNFFNIKNLLIFTGIVVILVSLGAYFVFSTNKSTLIVGEETLHQKQVDYEISMHPQGKDLNVQKTLKEKMITDSIILQAGSKENIITLNNTFYNNSTLDYAQRMAQVQKVQGEITKRSSWVKGTVITIWFLNANFVGPLGYEGSKAEALKKITSVYNKLKSNEITINDAKEIVRSDESLENLDRAYYTNAFIDFNTATNEQVTFDKSFNEMLKGVKTGEMSPITAIKEESPSPAFKGQTVEVLYAFAVVSENNGGSLQKFDGWLESQRKSYKVK